MRYRHQSTPNPPGSFKQTNSSGTVYPDQFFTLPAAKSQTTNDEVVDKFHQRRNQGEIFNNSFDSVKTEFIANDIVNATESQTGSWYKVVQQRYRLHRAVYEGSQPYQWPTIADSAIEEACIKASVQALGSVNSTEVDIAAFAGEWSKTKHLHRDVFNNLYDLLLKGPKGAHRRKARYQKVPLYDERGNPVLNRKGEPKYRYAHTPGGEYAADAGSQQTQNLANTYLMGRFGIIPLLKDLENALKMLHKTYRPRYTARGQEVIQLNKTGILLAPIGYGHSVVTTNIVRTFTARYGILYETDIMSRLLAGLGLTRPLSSTWELMTLSFVVDWLVDVGSYLDAIQPDGVTKTLSAWVSTHDFSVRSAALGQHVETQAKPTSNNYSWSLSWTGGCIETLSVKSRVPWQPSLPTRPPFGDGLNAIRSVDVAALMLQKIRSLGRRN